MDYAWFQDEYLLKHFTPDHRVFDGSVKLAGWSARQQVGSSVTISPAIPMLAAAAKPGGDPPRWQFDPGEGSNDRYPLWIGTTQYLWATGFDDRWVDWYGDLCDPEKPAQWGMCMERARRQQQQARTELAGVTHSTFGTIVEWLAQHWREILDFLNYDTPWGPAGKVVLAVVKTGLRYVWNGLKWIFHAFYDMAEEEIAAQPYGLESCPFGLVAQPGLPALPVSRTAAGTYGLVPRSGRPLRPLPELDDDDLAWAKA